MFKSSYCPPSWEITTRLRLHVLVKKLILGVNFPSQVKASRMRHSTFDCSLLKEITGANVSFHKTNKLNFEICLCICGVFLLMVHKPR